MIKGNCFREHQIFLADNIVLFKTDQSKSRSLLVGNISRITNFYSCFERRRENWYTL